MSDARPAAKGRPTVVPRIFTTDPRGVAAFMRAVLGAEGHDQVGRPAEMWIGESTVLVSDGGGVRAPMPACLYVHVPDVDVALERAVTAGAVVEEPVEAMWWGHRRATVRDPFGNVWQIATPIDGAAGTGTATSGGR